MLGSARPRRAAGLDEALAHFTADDFNETITGVNEVAASGSPRAEAIIRALQDGRLMYSADRKTVYIKDESGKLLDAATGQPIAGDAPADLDTVRLNNRLRGAIDAALGGLTLLAADPDKRLEAAQAVFKSRQASALPALESRPRQGTGPAGQARPSRGPRGDYPDRRQASEHDKLAAVEIIRQRGDQDALGVLSSMPADTPPPVATAAAAAIAAIQNTSYRMGGRAERVVRDISRLGSAARRHRACHHLRRDGRHQHGARRNGDDRRLCHLRRAGGDPHPNPALFDYSLAIAIPLSFVVAGCIGILIERTIIRFLYGRPLETLLATWGLSLILQQAVRTTFGPNNRDVGNPSWMSGAFDLGGITITYNRLWIICFALGGFRRLAGAAAFHALRPGNARGHSKPPDGRLDGHPHRAR